MKLNYLFFVCLLLAYSSSCKKTKPEPAPVTPTPTEADSVDIGVFYNLYESDSIYLNDTIKFNFRITNFDATTIPSGKNVLMACKFGSTVFALDLIGSGPTSVPVPTNLNQNSSFTQDSGYLLGSSLLAYFGVDSLDISLMAYGTDGAVISETFPSDKYPSNNKATLRIKPGQIELK